MSNWLELGWPELDRPQHSKSKPNCDGITGAMHPSHSRPWGPSPGLYLVGAGGVKVWIFLASSELCGCCCCWRNPARKPQSTRSLTLPPTVAQGCVDVVCLSLLQSAVRSDWMKQGNLRPKLRDWLEPEHYWNIWNYELFLSPVTLLVFTLKNWASRILLYLVKWYKDSNESVKHLGRF